MDTTLTTIATTVTVSVNTTDYTAIIEQLHEQLISANQKLILLNQNAESIKYLLNDAHSAVPFLALGVALIAGAIYLIRRI